MQFSLQNAALAAVCFASASIAQSEGCASVDQPNPIAADFPDQATGTLNGTLAVIPVSLHFARSIIPPQWKILEHAYRDMLPHFPRNKYPMILQGVHDHDIQLFAFDFHVPDFSRAGYLFPFLDLLGDGYSSFMWSPAQMLSADNPIALDGAAAFNQEVTPSVFDPACDAYACSRHGSYFHAAGVGDVSDVTLEMDFSPLKRRQKVPYPVEFFKNVTNQPMFFAEGGQCDLMVRFWDTALTEAPFEPRPVKGRVSTKGLTPFGAFKDNGVYGIQVDNAFVEYPGMECSILKGYDGTGFTLPTA